MYRAELTVSGRMAATLPLPAAARAFSAVIVEKVRLNEVIETFTVADDGDELEAEALVLVLVLVLVDEDEELLQAAAARHKASDTDVTTAPFLAIRIIWNHLAS